MYNIYIYIYTYMSKAANKKFKCAPLLLRNMRRYTQCLFLGFPWVFGRVELIGPKRVHLVGFVMGVSHQNLPGAYHKNRLGLLKK